MPAIEGWNDSLAGRDGEAKPGVPIPLAQGTTMIAREEGGTVQMEIGDGGRAVGGTGLAGMRVRMDLARTACRIPSPVNSRSWRG